MELKTIELKNAYRLLGHGPCVLVSAWGDDIPNACAVAWTAPVSKEPPRFSMRIGERHKTYKNLMATKACVIGIPTVDAIDQVMLCGKKSGNQGDKLSPAGITCQEGTKVHAPRLECCAGWLECEFKGNFEMAGSSMVLVEAVLVQCLADAMDADMHWDVERFPTLHHLGGSRFSVPGKALMHQS